MAGSLSQKPCRFVRSPWLRTTESGIRITHATKKPTVLLMTPAVILVVSRRRVQLCAIQTYCRYIPLQAALTSLGPLFSHCARDDNVPNHSNHHLLVTFAFVNVTVRHRDTSNAQFVTRSSLFSSLSILVLVLLEQHLILEKRKETMPRL